MTHSFPTRRSSDRRNSRGYKAAKFEENIGIELTWTIIPFLIIIGMAIPTTRTVVAMKDTSSADLTVKVTGYQWRAGHEYVDGPAAGVEFLSTLATPRAEKQGSASWRKSGSQSV